MGWRNPLETSEFEIQVIVYNELKKVFKNVRGEFHVKLEGKHVARFDCAVLDSENNVAFVIEVKRANKRNFWRQLAKYRALVNKPVFAISGEEQALRTLEIVRNEIGIPVPKHGDIYLDGQGCTPSPAGDTSTPVPL